MLHELLDMLDILLVSAKKQVLMVAILLGFSEFTSLRKWSSSALLVLSSNIMTDSSHSYNNNRYIKFKHSVNLS